MSIIFKREDKKQSKRVELKLNCEGFDIRKKAEEIFALHKQTFSLHIEDPGTSELKENEKLEDIISCKDKTPLLYVKLYQPEFKAGIESVIPKET